MERRLQYLIDELEAGSSIEAFLKSRDYSRQVLVQLKKTKESVLLNGRWAYMREILEENDCLEIYLSEEEASEQIEPVCLPFEIVYEDEDLMVINKPANMPVHPSINNHDNTLANAIAWYNKERGIRFPYRCINRLDKNTTGLLILAKHSLSAASLYRQMKERQIHRTYLALVKGWIYEAGTIDMPIARKEGSTIERVVDEEHGERAITHYLPLDWGDDWTLVQCELETGRTHQIRVHMSWLGHPLPGDFLYCAETADIDRQPLHSWKLSFLHPITGEEMNFMQPLPEDMTAYMSTHTM